MNTGKLFFKHQMATTLTAVFAKREDLGPEDIVAMAMHTAELLVTRISEELKQQDTKCKKSDDYEELNEIIQRFINENGF